MADRQRNIALARGGLEAFNRGDSESVVAALHPEIETHVSPGMMNSGTWHGLDGFRNGIGSWTDAWQDLHLEILDVEAVDDRHVLAFVRQTAVGPESGVPVEMNAVLLFEVGDDGRACRFHVHPDRESAEAAI